MATYGAKRLSTEKSTRSHALAAVYAAIICLVLPSFIWILRDRSVWPWDQAWYGQVSTDLWFWATHSMRHWASHMADGLNMKPPGIVWAGQFFIPLRGLFGSVEAALLSSILLTQFALLAMLFRLGVAIFADKKLIAFTGVVFAAGAQLFVGLSHEMFVEPLQTVAVVWTFVVAAQAWQWQKTRIVAELTMAAILGLLAKATTPLYCVAPGVYCLYVLIRRPDQRAIRADWKSPRLWVLTVVFGILGIACAAWYARHFGEAWEHIRHSSSSDAAVAYGFRDTVPRKLVVWLNLLLQSFCAPYLSWVLTAALGSAGVAYVALKGRSATRRIHVHRAAVLSAVQIAVMLLIFSINITVDSRYMYALLPCVAVIAMQVLAYVPPRLLPLLTAATVIQWMVVNAASFGLAAPLSSRSQWLRTLRADPTERLELARSVDITDAAGRYSIVAIEMPWLNANSASFFAAKRSLVEQGARGYYTSLGHAQQDVAQAMKRIEEFKTRYVITLGESHHDRVPNTFNTVSVPVLERMRSDPRFVPKPFDSKLGIVIFEFQPEKSTLLNAPEHAAEALSVRLTDGKAVPDLIARIQAKARGKSSLGWVNGNLPMQENGARVFSVRNGTLHSCLGWAFDDDKLSTPAEVWIELKNAKNNRRYYWKAVRYSRPELGAALNLSSIPMAGVECREGIRLPPGRYMTRIYQSDGASVIVSNLDTWEPSPVIVIK